MDPDYDDQQQAPMLPFGTSDGLQLQRLQAGMSQANDQLYSGEIDQDTHGQLVGQIGGMMQPLLQRQQATRAQQEQEQQGQIMRAAALQTAMQHEDSVHRARGFPDTIRSYTDPISGDTAHFYEARPGHLEQIDWPDQGGGTLGDSAGAAADSGSAAPDQGPHVMGGLAGLSSDVAGQSVHFGGDGTGQTPGNDVTLDASPTVSSPTPPAGPAVQSVQPQPDGSHVMTIVNGQNQERWKFDPDGTTTLIGAQGPRYAQQQPQGQGEGVVPLHVTKALGDQATQTFPLHQRGEFAPGHAGDVAYANSVNQTLAHRASFVNTQSAEYAKAQIGKQSQQATADRQAKAQAHQDSLQAEREKAKEKSDNYDRVFQFHSGQVHQERTKWTADDGTLRAGHPKYLDNDDDFGEAQSRAERQLAAKQQHMNPGSPRPGYSVKGNAAQMGPPAPQDSKRAHQMDQLQKLLGGVSSGQAFKRPE